MSEAVGCTIVALFAVFALWCLYAGVEKLAGALS